MLYYIHAYDKDAPLLALCLARVRSLDPEARVIIANDPAHPIPADQLPRGAWAEIVTPGYPLGGNLNGYYAIKGMLEQFVAVMERHQCLHLVKLDCDAWLNSVDWLRVGHLTQPGTPEPDYIGLENAQPLSAAGDCYRISLYACRAALSGLRARKWYLSAPMPEDAIILGLVLRARLPVLTIPHPEGRHVGMHAELPGVRQQRAWLVHCGETCADGSRAPRDFALLRMRLLAADNIKPITIPVSTDTAPATPITP